VDGGIPGTPRPASYTADEEYLNMTKGSQREARLNRLKDEIRNYVAVHPNCSAACIVDHLCNEMKMRNHGLTARKVGFFIPRYCKDITYELDSATGKRLYLLADQ